MRFHGSEGEDPGAWVCERRQTLVWRREEGSRVEEESAAQQLSGGCCNNAMTLCLPPWQASVVRRDAGGIGCKQNPVTTRVEGFRYRSSESNHTSSPTVVPIG